MNYLNIDYSVKNLPALDPDFIPLGVWMQNYLQTADRPFAIALEREDGKIHVCRSCLRSENYAAANLCYVERLVKFFLWSVGGFRVFLCGCEKEAQALQKIYSPTGRRRFDADFVHTVYERNLEIISCDADHFPEENEVTVAAGGHLDGCRIGFDAGGSDRKVSAVVDGQVVYSEEVTWFPKTHADPAYHYEEILAAFRSAASHMPRVDAIGVSTAGVVVGQSPMYSSLFLQVPSRRRQEVKTIYTRAAAAFGPVPLTVANDGDVTALAGAMSFHGGAILGLAMGTSEAAGYAAEDGNLSGWLNELAFAPVDLNENAPMDDWSMDRGIGSQYFSQDAVIRLAMAAGITLDETLSPAEKLRVVQQLVSQGHPGALSVFRTMGTYLAHTLVLYARFYPLRRLLILGRVVSGVGGDVMVAECGRVLEEEYPDLRQHITLTLPDETTRRVGQSAAAASLPITAHSER